MSEDELAESDDPCTVTTAVEIELPQELPNLQGVLESWTTNKIIIIIMGEYKGKSIKYHEI